MVEPLTPPNEIREDLRRNDRRESQLWVLTLGLLALFGTGALVGFYVLSEESLGSYQKLGGLAVLTTLFCLYVLHARASVGRVKHLLIEINGVATANLELDRCLPGIVRGMAEVHSANLCRIAILRSTEPALEWAASYVTIALPGLPEDGTVCDLEHLPLCRGVLEKMAPLILNQADLQKLPEAGIERTMLTGGNSQIDSVLVLPMPGNRNALGLVVLGRQSGFWRPTYAAETVSAAMNVVRHAATAIDESIRKREATRDPLTELYNRRYFDERMGDEIARAARDGLGLAILLCDLDEFKSINDTMGHRTGDDVLKVVATALRDATRGTDLHFRWGGDEMVVVLRNTDVTGAVIAAERVRNAVVRYAVQVGVDLDVSIGIALFPQHGTEEMELIHAADLAMYMAKRSGDKIRVGYERHALTDDCVRLVYQPIVHVESGEIIGHEVRIRDPEGRLSPSELFKKYGAVGQLKRLKQLILELQLRDAERLGLSRLFVNADLELLDRLETIEKPGKVDVIFEIARLDSNHQPILDRWRGAGYRFAIDDQASSLSLSFIAALAPDYIRVGRATLRQAVESSEFQIALHGLLRAVSPYTAEGVVIEGVETETERQTVCALGVCFALGSLFGTPQEMSSTEARSVARTTSSDS